MAIAFFLFKTKALPLIGICKLQNTQLVMAIADSFLLKIKGLYRDCGARQPKNAIFSLSATDLLTPNRSAWPRSTKLPSENA